MLGAWGVSGWVRVEPLTDDPARFRRLQRARFVSRQGGGQRLLHVREVRVEGAQVRLAFAGVENREEAQSLAGGLLQVRREEAAPLAEGRYYRFQLLGLQVWTVEGRLLGRLAEVLETGANDVLVVVDDRGRELLLPATREVVLRVDLEAGRMEVALLPGLEEATGRAHAHRRHHPVP